MNTETQVTETTPNLRLYTEWQTEMEWHRLDGMEQKQNVKAFLPPTVH